MVFKQLVYNLPPFLTAVLLAGLAVVAILRGRGSRANRLFAVLCLFSSLLYVDILIGFNAPTATVALTSNRIGHLLHPFLVPLFIHFFHAYLGISKRSWIVGLAYGFAIFLSACAPSDLLIAGVRRFNFGYFAQRGPLYPLMAAGATFATLYNLSLIYGAIMQEKRSIEKNKLKYVFTGFISLGLLSSLNILTIFGYPVYPPGSFGFIPMALFAAGIFKYDLLDMGLVIRRSLLYSALMALMTILYALIIVAAQWLATQGRMTGSLLFLLLLFILITLVFGPLKNWTQTRMDRLFAKGRYDYRQTIKQVSQTIATVLDYDAIAQLLRQTIIETMQVKTCALFVASLSGGRFLSIARMGFAPGTEVPSSLAADAFLTRHLEQTSGVLRKQQLLGTTDNDQAGKILAELALVQGEVVLPMRFKQRLKGFLVLGEKRSGDMYDSEDLDLLETLGHQSALAIENARSYQALQELNRNLEAKVVARTHDLKAALEEKERTQEQLIRSESLAALGQLVAGVAHELNNPLASVTSLLQSTVEDLQHWDGRQPLEDDLFDDLAFADKELARAKTIVSSLLGLARQTQTYEEAVAINAVVGDALRVQYNQYKHTRLKIVESLEEDLPTVQGNFANLGQVALNIIQNAIQAVADQDGEIVLTTAYDSHQQQVVFRCQDNGPGIARDERRDVFKPFFTTKPVGQGTGLGLYICHEIVRKHGGHIDLEPAEPNGALVTVRLPAQK